MNRKGFSLAGWIEVGLGVILFMVCIGLVVSDFNSEYNQTNNPTFNIVTNDTLTNIESYLPTIEEGMQGEATTSELTGISLGTAWGMIKAGLSITFNIVTGSWIENAVGLLHWGTAGIWLGRILRLIFIISIGLILLKMILKINP